MKTVFKLSLLSVLLVAGLANASGGAASANAINANAAFQLGFTTGIIPAVIGGATHYGALQSGATPTNAALAGLGGGAIGGMLMRAARADAIGQAFGPQHRSMGVMGALTSLTTVGVAYWMLIGGPKAAEATAKESAAQEAKRLLAQNRGR